MTPNELTTLETEPEGDRLLGIGALIDQEISRHAGNLNELLTAEERIGIELARALREHKHRRGKLVKAITALREIDAPPQESPQLERKRKNFKNWRPSSQIIERVYSTFVDADEPLTVTDAAKITGHAIETVRKAVDALRSDERLRLAGHAKRPGAPKLFAPMPSVPLAEAV